MSNWKKTGQGQLRPAGGNDITDVEPGDVESGMGVKRMFRLKETDEKRGFRRYFWKAVPVRS